MADLLIELGCEDLPAGSVVPLAEHLHLRVFDALRKAELLDEPVREAMVEGAVFATPRRVATLRANVGERQPDREVERKGPAVAAAYDADGQPTKALQGFLRSANASVDELSTIETPKGSWVVLRQRQPGRTLADVLAEALPEIVRTMPMPRRMRWGAGEHEFLRPVVWLLAVHGSETLPISVLGLEAGNVTYGHRFHAPGRIRIEAPADYERALMEAKVFADPVGRREKIVREVRLAAEEAGGIVTRDDAHGDDPLFDEVTSLVEWPVALAGRFDEAFLEIPDEALIQTMEENQRYFALRDAEGALMNAFVTVANIESTNPATVVDGNERVILPRFADTMFFWAQDKKRTLADWRPALDRVLFQEKLGSVGDKVARLEALVGEIAPVTGADADEARLAASLCKSDLVSAIVEELPKMQGIAGRHYAAREGHPDGVAAAMEEHYFPKQAGGALPSGAVGRTLALADKADTLVGIHGQGLVPSGAKDPFALRRASLGIVRILREGGLDMDVAALVAAAAKGYAGRVDDIDEGAIVAYVIERLRGYLVDGGSSADAVDAVLAKGLSHPLDIDARLEAIERFRKTEAATSLAAANKRIANILRKAETAVPDAIDAAALVDPAEHALANALEAARPDIEARFAARDYAGAMAATATLREPVDAFFDAVMVMDEDPRLRDNRLALLAQVERLCGFTAELSRLDARLDGARPGAPAVDPGADSGAGRDAAR